MPIINQMLKKTGLRRLAILFICLLVTACASHTPQPQNQGLVNQAFLPAADLVLNIEGLSTCTNTDDKTLALNSKEPVIIIVHGCFPSSGMFRSLADVYAFHGQQAICFNYDDRDSLEKSSHDLIVAIEKLSDHLVTPKISVLGHSQGGLVARRAVIKDRDDALNLANIDLNLTTISAPFNGIESSSHCGSKTLAWLSLGLTKVICWAITGEKYTEIPPNSDFIRHPGELLPALTHHLEIRTDEAGTCRRQDVNGKCTEDDFVFSLAEQNSVKLAKDERVASVTVKAGHVEIVGSANTAPLKLITILQAQGLMKSTPVAAKDEFAQLLQSLYFTVKGDGGI